MVTSNTYTSVNNFRRLNFERTPVTKVFLTGTAEEIFYLHMSLAPSIGDELMLNNEPHLITSRRFIVEDTEHDTKNVDHAIRFVRKAWL